jgi:large subunit ribosomal protein L4e
MPTRQVPVLNLEGEPEGKVRLPEVFLTPFRPDVIHRVYVALDTHRRQPQGRDPFAGKRTSAETYNPPTGRGISRLPRVKGSGYARAGQVAGVASVVKGRQAHPPRAEKRIRKEVNVKERRLATASAIAATALREVVAARGHRVDELKLPLVVVDRIEEVSRTRELLEVLERLGLGEELERCYQGRKRRSGKPRMRGRVTREPKGPLLVVAEDRGVSRAARNIPGVECVKARDLSVLHLAPGAHPGRLTVWSTRALEVLGEVWKA